MVLGLEALFGRKQDTTTPASPVVDVQTQTVKAGEVVSRNTEHPAAPLPVVQPLATEVKGSLQLETKEMGVRRLELGDFYLKSGQKATWIKVACWVLTIPTLGLFAVGVWIALRIYYYVHPIPVHVPEETRPPAAT